MTISIQHTSLHHIDHLKVKAEKIDISDQGKALTKYIRRLIKEISTSSNRRSFVFQRDSTEVRTTINGFIQKDYSTGTKSNADRLLVVEQEAQQAISQLKVKIPQGSLFQAIIVENNLTKIIISKADHSEYLDEKDFLVHKGLPWKKRVFKAVLITLKGDKSIDSVFVFDTNSTMAKYWWQTFLELKDKHTNTHNTVTSLKMLDLKVFNPIKTKHPADHMILRNSAVGYFRTKEEFELKDFIDTIFTNYQPIDQKLSKEKMIAKTSELPERWNFDTRFKIKKDKINQRIVNKVVLTESIDLVIKDYLPHLSNDIVAEKDNEGNKYIKIRTDAGYDRFTNEFS